MLLSMLFDDDEEDGVVTALFQVGDYVVQIKQRPTEGRECDKDLEKKQEEAMAADMSGASATPGEPPSPTGKATAAPTPPAAPQQLCAPDEAASRYVSAFPNVGLVVWQAGFVLGEYLLRSRPLGSWQGVRVLELGAGVGQLGCVLAMTGAEVTMTDLPHIVPWTERNICANEHAMPVRARASAYVWGSDPGTAGLGSPCDWDVVVAADVLYEPQYYGQLLASLRALCCADGRAGGGGRNGGGAAGGVRGDRGSDGFGGDGDVPGAGDCRAELVCCSRHSSGANTGSSAARGGSSGGGSSGGSRSGPRCFLCYRRRQYREDGFEGRAVAAGFAVLPVSAEQLHPEYRCGGYRLVELVWQLEAQPPPVASAVGAAGASHAHVAAVPAAAVELASARVCE